MQNIDQVLDLSNCFAAFTYILTWCVSVCEKAAESQTGDDAADAVTLHKIIWKSEFSGSKNKRAQCPLGLYWHENACTKHYEVKLSHRKHIFCIYILCFLIEGWGCTKYWAFHWFERKIYAAPLSLVCHSLHAQIVLYKLSDTTYLLSLVQLHCLIWHYSLHEK